MILDVISFTKNGQELSEKICRLVREGAIPEITEISLACKWHGAPHDRISVSLDEWTRSAMERKHVLLFIGACGIAVRAIAPYVENKLYDSPVLVCDELGTFVIPLLSGHMGGANELAVKLSEYLGAVPVITTATDLNRKFAVDLFAKENELAVMNKDGIAKVSSKILHGEPVTISIEGYPPKHAVDIVVTSKNKPFDASLLLKPKLYAIGVGCKKGKEAEKLETWICENLDKVGISDKEVFALASIDVKKEEAGLIAWADKQKLPFFTYSAEELSAVSGDFDSSAFVEQQVGVGNVCERAAMRACGDSAELVLRKQSFDGMTIAIAKRTWSVKFDEK